MSNNQQMSVDQALPAAPSGAARSDGLPAVRRPVPGSVRPAEPAASSADTEPVERLRALRIGDKVRSHVDDVCVSVGLTGMVVNVAPPRYGAPARARILWDNETVSMADAQTFEVIAGRDTTTENDESRVA